MVWVNLSLYLAIQLSSSQERFSEQLTANYFWVANLIWLVCGMTTGLYRNETVQRLESIYRASWRSVVLHGLIFVFFFAFSYNTQIERSFLVVWYVLMGFFFLLARFISTYMESVLVKYFRIRKSVAVLGMNGTGLRLAAYFEQNQNNYQFEGFLNEENRLYVDEYGSLLPSATAQIKSAASSGVKEVYVSLTTDRMFEAGQLVREAEKQCVRLKFVPDLAGSLASPFSVSYMGDFPVINLRPEPLENIQNRFKKRAFDILFSSLVIVFILSWLYPILALIIKLQSPGPVLFKQVRSGRNNEPFWCYKFRSMHVNSKSDQQQASKNDSRITRIGRFMRKTSLDELPQFFNVLFGDMTVIGPRPHMVKHTEQYSAIINQYMVRHFLKPGISGWAQVHGFRGETREQKQMEKRVEHDIWYLENWSLMLDVRIVFMTVINLLRGEENAY
jgi:putative colanic acid biosynthesis UDP-glucose lipid carrier transferase